MSEDDETGGTELQRQMDFASALGEILFSLIMVLTTTLTPSLTTAEERERAAMGGD
jgi:hypothetical protein